MADWCGSPAAGTTAVSSMPHRIKAGQGVDGPPVTLPNDPRLYVYAMTLD